MSNAAHARPGLRPVKEMNVEFDLDSMTLDQIDQWEEITGEDFDDAFAAVPILLPDGSPLYNKAGEPMLRRIQKTKHLRAMLQVLNPDIPASELGKIRLSQLGGETPNPKEQPKPKSARNSRSSTA